MCGDRKLKGQALWFVAKVPAAGGILLHEFARGRHAAPAGDGGSRKIEADVARDLPLQGGICCVVHKSEPLGACIFSGILECQVAKPRISSGAVPMWGVCGNFHDAARM